MDRNKLKINCTKTVCMLIGTKCMLQKQSTLNLQIYDNTIEQVQHFKYLGIFIDSELKWTVHIDYLCKKISKMVSFLGRLSKYINESCLILLYNAVIIPHFDYGDVVWSSATKTQLDILHKIQNRAGRIILEINVLEHGSAHEIHDILNWKTLQIR